jgi:hypothetical protein
VASPVKLHQWFVVIEPRESHLGWGVVVFGRQDGTRLTAHPLVQRISDLSFLKADGSLVELVGPADTERAAAAGGLLPSL